MTALESSIKNVESSVRSMYFEPFPNTLEYRLHAVLVHEGSVNSGEPVQIRHQCKLFFTSSIGHYWAYIYDRAKKSWLKFNDNSVTEASWEELQKESVGGHRNASAYSLIYLDASKANMILDASYAENNGKEQKK